MTGIKLYWGAPLFTQAERIWNRMCATILRENYGYTVLLPQEEAERFIDTETGTIDFDGIVETCEEQARSAHIGVFILDGADSDSGTSVEAGIRIGIKTPSIGVRTDFRGSEDGRVNAMFRLLDTIVYFPSYDESVDKLCGQIDRAIQKVLSKTS